MSKKNATGGRFGSHMSIAGGLELAFDRGLEVGCDCLQIFVKNQRQWAAKPLTEEVIAAFHEAHERTGLNPVVAHSTYLINLASPDAALRRRSSSALTDELWRCHALDVPYLVLHPGAHMGEGVARGIRRIIGSLNKVHRAAQGCTAQVLLETTAGQGSAIGASIEELGKIIDGVAHPDRMGVCLDTCHLFAAGYDLTEPAEYERTVNELERMVGLDRVRCIHVNDSKRECGSRVDRHDHIGKGRIGRGAFVRLVNDKRFAGVPMILETAKDKDSRGRSWDKVNLNCLRRMMGR